MFQSIFIHFGVAVFAVSVASPVFADRIPQHLANMAATLFKSTSSKIEKETDPNNSKDWATIRSKDILKAQGIHRWRRGAPPAWQGRAELSKALKLDVTLPEDQTKLNDFITSAYDVGAKTALEKFYKTQNTAEALDKPSLEKIDRLLVAGYTDLKRKHGIETEFGQKIDFLWQPENGRFDIQVTEPGSEFIAPFQTILSGQITPRTHYVDDEDQSDFVLEPAPVPIRSLDAQDLSNIRNSVFGEWLDGSGEIWLIAPSGTRTRDQEEEERSAPNARGQTLDRLADAEAELADLREATVFVWENTVTGAKENQKKFRRKTDPWEYKGEQSGDEESQRRIAELEGEIIQLNKILGATINVQKPPALADETADGQVQTIEVNYTRKDGSIARMRSARLAGTAITGQRTLNDIRDIRGLPQDVITQLIGSWYPPEWIELELSLLEGSPQITGKLWRLHVTYDGSDNSVSSIQTPYARPLVLRPKNQRKAP